MFKESDVRRTSTLKCVMSKNNTLFTVQRFKLLTMNKGRFGERKQRLARHQCDSKT